MNLFLRFLCVKKIRFGFYFSQKHDPQWRIFSLRNAWFPTSTKNLGSGPSFPSSSVQTKCYVVKNVKSSVFQVMFSLRCCLSEFLKKLFHLHKGKGVYSTSRTKSLMPTPIIRLPPIMTCSNVFICPDTMWESTPVFACVFWWAVACIGLVFIK